MITVKNVSTSVVSLYVPNIKLNRELMPGRVLPLSQEEYEELTFDPGFMALINGHYLAVDGIDESQRVADVGEIYSAERIAKMLDTNDITNFARFIPNATDAEKDSVVTIAIEHKITNQGLVTLIKKYCDVDIIDAIAKKHEAEEK